MQTSIRLQASDRYLQYYSGSNNIKIDGDIVQI